MLISGVITITTTPLYEATATILVSLPFGEFGNPSSTAELAVLQSTALPQKILVDLQEPNTNENASALARRVRVSNDLVDKSVFRITAQAFSPREATRIANAWATAGLEELQNTFMIKSSNAKALQSQIALERLKQADNALVNFVQANGLAWDDVVAFELTLGNSQNFPIQISGRSFSFSSTVSDNLSRLLRERQVATRTYMKLARGAAEADIASRVPSAGLELLNPATEPTTPVQPRPLQNMVIAVIVGMTVGFSGAFVKEHITRQQKPKRVD
jgi:uncharacterized protein involved in exopolysaccharide biosynthesis